MPDEPDATADAPLLLGEALTSLVEDLSAGIQRGDIRSLEELSEHCDLVLGLIQHLPPQTGPVADDA